MPFLINWGNLGEDGSGCVIRAVSFDAEGSRRVGRDEDGSRSDATFESIEGRLLGRLPMPLGVVLGQVKEGSHVLREALDETAVEVGEAKE